MSQQLSVPSVTGLSLSPLVLLLKLLLLNTLKGRAGRVNQILPNQSQLYDACNIVFPTRNERLTKTASGSQRSSFFRRVFRRTAVCSGGPQYVANAKDPNLTAKSASDYLRADIRKINKKLIRTRWIVVRAAPDFLFLPQLDFKLGDPIPTTWRSSQYIWRETEQWSREPINYGMSFEEAARTGKPKSMRTCGKCGYGVSTNEEDHKEECARVIKRRIKKKQIKEGWGVGTSTETKA